MLRTWGIALFVSLCVGSTGIAAPPSMNLTRALADTKSLLNSGQTADILMLGDSLSFRDGSYLPYFRALMQNRYGNAGYGYQGFSLWTGGGVNNGWLREGLNADISPHRALDGLWNEYNGSAAWPNIAHMYPRDKYAQIQYISGPGRGSFELWSQASNGTLITSISTNASTTGLSTYNYALGPGENAFTYWPANDGSLTILGVNSTNGQNGVRIHRAANGGWGVGNFLQRDWTFDAQINAIEPELVMVWLGQNDQSYTRASYNNALNQMVDRIQNDAPAAEIVLIGTYDQGSPLLAPLVEAMSDVAGQRGLGFINIYKTAGDAAFFNANGFLDDGVHFSHAGGQYLGRFLYDAFATDGRSLIDKGGIKPQPAFDPALPGPQLNSVVPEPAAALCGFLALALSMRRVRD